MEKESDSKRVESHNLSVSSGIASDCCRCWATGWTGDSGNCGIGKRTVATSGATSTTEQHIWYITQLKLKLRRQLKLKLQLQQPRQQYNSQIHFRLHNKWFLFVVVVVVGGNYAIGTLADSLTHWNSRSLLGNCLSGVCMQQLHHWHHCDFRSTPLGDLRRYLSLMTH